MAPHPLAARAGLVVAATAGIALVLGRLLADVLLDASAAAERSGPAALDASVGAVAAAGALLTLGWWVTSFTFAVVGQARAAVRCGRSVLPPPSAAPSAAPSAVPSAAWSVATSMPRTVRPEIPGPWPRCDVPTRFACELRFAQVRGGAAVPMGAAPGAAGASGRVDEPDHHRTR